MTVSKELAGSPLSSVKSLNSPKKPSPVYLPKASRLVHISKKPFQWGDTYVIDIVDPKDEVMALMLAIAIDAANCTK